MFKLIKKLFAGKKPQRSAALNYYYRKKAEDPDFLSKMREKSKIRYQKRKAAAKKYYQKNKERLAEYSRKRYHARKAAGLPTQSNYAQKNDPEFLEKRRAYHRAYVKNRRKTDPVYAEKMRLAAREAYKKRRAAKSAIHSVSKAYQAVQEVENVPTN